MSKKDSIKKGLKAIKNIREKELSLNELVEGILSGNILMLSKAITLIESNKEDQQFLAQQIIDKCIPYSGKSHRIGITGVPGVGKSSFIEALGNYLINETNRKIAVLAIDPSSQSTKGSILGDKTRMEKLAAKSRVYVRPSPTKGTLGGVAQKTRESIILCEAAGFDTIFIETVGVGQSETSVHSMVDFFLLLMLAGGGDELQGIKRGIMELAHAVAITKADGDNIKSAEKAMQNYKNALHFFPSQKQWSPQVTTCSSITKEGIEHIWKTIGSFFKHIDYQNQRGNQAKYWLHETIQKSLNQRFYSNKKIQEKLITLEQKVIQQKISPFKAAAELLED